MQLKTLAQVGTGAVGLTLTLFGILEDGKIDASDIRAIGFLLLWVTTAAVAVGRLSRPANAAYELGELEGFRAGYEEGRSVRRPTVVPLRPDAVVSDAAVQSQV